MGGASDGVGTQDNVEPPLDVVQAPHTVQQPLDVAKGDPFVLEKRATTVLFQSRLLEEVSVACLSFRS